METVVKKIEELKSGETLLVSARKVAGGKVSVEFAEIIKREGQQDNLVALFNAGDVRFNQTAGPRRAWPVGEPAAIEKLLNIDLSDLPGDGSPKEFNILNPTINNVRVRVQIEERLTPFNEWQKANVAKAAKNNGNAANRLYFVKDGKYIFSDTKLAHGEAQHNIIFIKDEAGNFLPNCGMLPFSKSIESQYVPADSVGAARAAVSAREDIGA